MAMFNSPLLFLLLVTTLLAFIVGWLSRKLIDGGNENILKQKIAVLRNTVAEQKDALNTDQDSMFHAELSSVHLEPREISELVELRLQNQKLLDSENDLKVKLSQLYSKKQREINRLNAESDQLKARLDSIKDELILNVESGPVKLAADDAVRLEIESQQQTIGRLENQLKVETDIYKKRIDELERAISQTAQPDVTDDFAAKEAELTIASAKPVASTRPAAAKKKPRKKASTVAAKPATRKVNKSASNRKKVTAQDDLSLIKGIGPKIQAILHDNGITRFEQIAALKAADVRKLADQLGSFRNRIKRDEWVKQAKQLIK